MDSYEKNNIENLQRQSTKIIPGFKKLTYEECLEKLKLQTLKYRRLRGWGGGGGGLMVVYNILHVFYDEQDTSELSNIMYQAQKRGHSLKMIKHRSR